MKSHTHHTSWVSEFGEHAGFFLVKLARIRASSNICTLFDQVAFTRLELNIDPNLSSIEFRLLRFDYVILLFYNSRL